MITVAALAAQFDTAAHTETAIAQLGDELTLSQAYEMQALSMRRRYERGKRRIGIKMRIR